MKRVYLFLMMCIIGLISPVNAQEIQIGSGYNFEAKLPTWSFFNYSYSQQIYTAEELGGEAGLITSIAFKQAGEINPANRNVEVYMINTTKDSFSTVEDWEIVTAENLVFSGELVYTAVIGEWTEITLQTPFDYSGGNLLICMNDVTGTYIWGQNYYIYETGANRTLYSADDVAPYDISNPGVGGYMVTYCNQIKLNMAAGGGSVTVNPNVIDLGYRPNGYWMRPFEVTVSAVGGSVNLTALEGTEAYFNIPAVEVPTTLIPNYPIELAITHGEGEGEINGMLIVAYAESKGAEMIDMSAVAYDPVSPDVWELAQEVTEFPFTDTPENIYDNYLLPGEAEDGADAVYKLVLENDVYMNATIEGENGKMALYEEDFEGEEGPGADNYFLVLTESVTLQAGTYYLVASATDEFTVNIETSDIPAPEKAFNPDPENMAQNVTNPVLTWEFSDYTIEYQVLFGNNYPPSDVVVDWTDELATEYIPENVYNNKNYFWQVNVRNTSGTTNGDVWAFTTSLNVPEDVRAEIPNIYEGEEALIEWTNVQDRTHRGYNVYVNGEKNNTEVITENMYSIAGLTYNMEGYDVNVTAVYDEGESAFSETAKVYVTGNGYISGYTYEQDGTTIVGNVAITLSGVDEFGASCSFQAVSNENGEYSAEVLAGTYSCIANKDGYQTNISADVVVNYEETTNFNFSLTETYYPVYQVIAEEVDESVVKVYWSWGEIIPEALIENFETGDFSAMPWNNEVSDYPWAVTTDAAYEGTYGMKSTNAGIDNSISAIEITVEVPYDGAMSFYHKVSSESSWDNGLFYIDGAHMATATGELDWTYKEVSVTEGIHTYRWEYMKDGSLANGDDTYYIDYITFYQEVMPIEGGWICYDDGIYKSNVGTGSPSPVYWGISFPNTEAYVGNTLTTISVYDSSDSGLTGPTEVTANIYLGGTDAPGTLVCSETVTLTGINNFVEVELSTPIVMDGSQSLWIMMYCDQLAYPAAGCEFVGDNNSDWISLDGASWDHAMADYGLSFTWMIRGLLESSKGEAKYIGYNTTIDSQYPHYETLTFEGGASTGTLVANENATAKVVGTPSNEMAEGSRAFSYYNVYRSNCYNDEAELIAENVTDTVFADIYWGAAEPGVYKWGVSAHYEGNRSSNVIFEEGFEGGVIPEQWLTYASEGLAPGQTAEWQVATCDEMMMNFPYEGDYAAFSNGSYTGGDFYLVTPGIVDMLLAESAELKFHFITPSWSGDINNLTVAVSSSSEGPWTDLWTTNYSDYSQWTEATIDLTEYAGEIIYIAFICGNDYGFCAAVDNIQITTESAQGGNPIVWSDECIDKDMFTAIEVAAATNSGDSPAGTVVTLRSISEPEMGYDYEVTLDGTGYYAWDSFRKGTYELTIALEGFNSCATAEVLDIWEETTIDCLLEEIAFAVEGLYVSPTGWAMWEGANLGGGGGGGGGTPMSEWLYYDDGVNVDAIGGPTSFYWGVQFPADVMSAYAGTFLTTVSMYDYAANSGGQIMIYQGGTTAPETLVHTQDFSGTGAGAFVDYELTSAIPVDASQSMWIVMSTVMGSVYPASGCNNTGDPNGRWISMDNVVWEDLVGYGLSYTWMIRGFVTNEFKGEVSTLEPIEISYMKGEGEFAAAGKANVGERALTSYTIMLDGSTVAAELLTPFYQHEDLVDGQEYTTTVIANYSTGSSEPMEYTWTYVDCDNFEGLTELTGEYVDGEAVISWTLPEGGGGGGTQIYTYGFESGMEGWTTIDNNLDGHTWYHSSETTNHSTIAGNSHTGEEHICSESYCNGMFAPLTPDDYVIAPEKMAIGEGSYIKFFAAAQDANYAADHIGVAVSTAGNTSAADFTTIWEHTMTAKATGKVADKDVRGRDQGQWYEFEIDLSAYAGQEAWVALRHFNCTDQFIVIVDDVEIAAGGNGGGGGGGGGGGTGLAFGFEDGMEGWTTINANGDGHTWYHSDEAANHSVLAGTPHSGSGHICSESFCNATFTAMEPDDYAVAPEKYAVADGAYIKFWAGAQDVNYASDHIGIAVSTAGNTSGDDFTTIWEHTMTGKSGDRGERDIKGTRQGTWYEFTVDLSDYAGEEVWLAVRHFNCYDQFIVKIDDVEINTGGKGERGAWDLMHSFNLTSAGQQGVATDGNYIYTCSWQASPTGGYGFYKYELDGTFIEGFNITGAGQVRDLTYDGEYFYGSSGGSQIYILDLENKTKVGDINCSGLTARHLSYDPEMDGFWSGNWETLALYDRNGALVHNAPAPTSAYGSGYFVDENGNPHIYLFTQANADAKVYDYDINSNTINPTPIFDFAQCPGFAAGSISGGAFIGEYNGKTAFFGNLQQEPNLVGIYELGEGTGGGGGGGGGNANADIVGVMLYRDGELITNEPLTATSYSEAITDDLDHEYCVRIVYAGEPDDTYYAMSCPECVVVEPVMACDAPEDLYGEVYQDGDDFGALLTWPYSEPASDWLYYDDGTNMDAIGGPESFYWGIQIPADVMAEYAGTYLTKVSMYDYAATSGGQIMIYLGGSSAPTTLVHTQDYSGTGAGTFVEYELTAPIPVDETQSLWIVMSTVMGTVYPASCSNNTGDPNGRWISMDGIVWEDLVGYGLSYTWMIRGFVTNEAKGEVSMLSPIDFEYTEGTGKLAAAGTANRGRELDHYNIYRGTSANDFELIAETDASPYFDAVNEDGTYYYQVTAVYVEGDEECESDPANSYLDPEDDYVVVEVTSIDENGVNGMMIYPNPTQGDLNISAENMQRISISNTLGQMVYDQAVDSDNHIINMAQYEAGVYMVRIVTESGVAVKRITVVR